MNYTSLTTLNYTNNIVLYAVYLVFILEEFVDSKYAPDCGQIYAKWPNALDADCANVRVAEAAPLSSHHPPSVP